MSDLGNREIMAANIQRLMERKGRTRAEVCEDLGLKYTTFTDWVKGKTYPRIDKIELMANYFGVSKSELVERSEPDDLHGAVAGTSMAPPRLASRLSEISREKSADTYGGLTYEQICQLGEYNARERLDAAFAKLDLIGREKVANYAEKLARDPKRQRDPKFPYTRRPKDDDSEK